MASNSTTTKQPVDTSTRLASTAGERRAAFVLHCEPFVSDKLAAAGWGRLVIPSQRRPASAFALARLGLLSLLLTASHPPLHAVTSILITSHSTRPCYTRLTASGLHQVGPTRNTSSCCKRPTSAHLDSSGRTSESYIPV